MRYNGFIAATLQNAKDCTGLPTKVSLEHTTCPSSVQVQMHCSLEQSTTVIRHCSNMLLALARYIASISFSSVLQAAVITRLHDTAGREGVATANAWCAQMAHARQCLHHTLMLALHSVCIWYNREISRTADLLLLWCTPKTVPVYRTLPFAVQIHSRQAIGLWSKTASPAFADPLH